MKFLLCVGAEKAATTWLYQYFKDHPQYHNIGKELNIVQRDDLVPCLEEVDEYRKDIESFFRAVSKINSVTGDFTHYEGSSENLFRLIKSGLGKYDIDVVPVYIMRDPIKRAWSAWNMLGGGRIKLPKAAKFVMTNHLSCKYKETIQALDSVFSEPIYLFYEELFKQESIDTICDALQISKMPADFSVVGQGYYKNKITNGFIKEFGKSKKNLDAVSFIRERFDHVPWDIENYQEEQVG